MSLAITFDFYSTTTLVVIVKNVPSSRASILLILGLFKQQ